MEANEAPDAPPIDAEDVAAEGVRLGIVDAGAAVEVASLTHNPLNAVTDAIHRVEWPGGVAVRKVVTPNGRGAAHWAASHDPHHFNYWCREAMAYRTDLPGRLGLDAPALLGHDELTDGSVVLWLEAVEGSTGESVTVAHLGRAAHQLGVSQGNPVLPDDPWLSRDFIRTYGESKPIDPGLLVDPKVRAHPHVVDSWSDELWDGLVALHDDRERWRELLGRLPRTICHLDVWPNNLVVRPKGSVAFFDWSFTGHGALGEDIGNLVPDTVLDLLMPADRLDELEGTTFSAYVEGLREGGWRGDQRLVRVGMYASAVKYHWLAPLLLARLDAPEHLAYGRAVDPGELYAQRGAALLRLVRWSNNALRLGEQIGLV